MIPPHGATIDGTTHFHEGRDLALHEQKIREFQDLKISSLALGTYLGAFDDATDQAYASAVIHSLKKGINFFDTAINYRCQRSERVLGQVLKQEIAEKRLHRSQFVISTKGGFIPFDGEPARNMAEYIDATWIKRGLVKPDEIISSCHCLMPAFLQTQIDASLENLQLNTIDLYYLHNPELELPVLGATLFYARLKSAFALLEENISKGKIQFYGLATWAGFREGKGSASALDFEKIMSLAREVGGPEHHFAAIQLPYNLAMLEAIEVQKAETSESLTSESLTILALAKQNHISVFTSAPLLQGQLLNLPPQLMKKIPGDFTVSQKALQFVTSTPSVASAMVGMKAKAHIEENTKILHQKNWDLATLQKICEVVTKR